MKTKVLVPEITSVAVEAAIHRLPDVVERPVLDRPVLERPVAAREEAPDETAPDLIRKHGAVPQPAGILKEQPCGEDSSPVAEANRPRILPFCTKGGKSPVFLVHPLSGSVEMYRQLVGLLDLDRPCYGIRAPADTAGHSESSIEGIAAAYLESARTLLGPDGKAVFAGYSLGGAIAYEMARQHAESSGTAPAVLIIDCESGVSRPRPQVALDAIFALPGWLRHVAPKRDPKDLLSRFVNRLRRILGFGGEARIGGGPAARAQQLWMAALNEYAARPYSGAVVLLRAKHQGLFCRRDPALGWGGLAPNLRVDIVPGSHEDCLWRENLSLSAEILGRHLDSFD